MLALGVPAVANPLFAAGTLVEYNNTTLNHYLGAHQYAWFEQRLAGSQAKYKFVFTHSLVGGLDGQMRGGLEAAPLTRYQSRPRRPLP